MQLRQKNNDAAEARTRRRRRRLVSAGDREQDKAARWVRVPQDISVARMRCSMSEAAWRVLEVVLFECYAFDNRVGRAQPIGLRWFIERTQLSMSSVQRALAQLESRRIIAVIRSGHNRTRYAIRPAEMWTPARARAYRAGTRPPFTKAPLHALERAR